MKTVMLVLILMVAFVAGCDETASGCGNGGGDDGGTHPVPAPAAVLLAGIGAVGVSWVKQWTRRG